jgi:hypothetical protein
MFKVCSDGSAGAHSRPGGSSQRHSLNMLFLMPRYKDCHKGTKALRKHQEKVFVNLRALVFWWQLGKVPAYRFLCNKSKNKFYALQT